MATKIKPVAKNLYEEDFYVWSGKQAELLRERRFDELDLANLIEDVEDLGGALRRSARLHVMNILEHLLKLQHWPRSEQRLAWRGTVRRERSELTPSLRCDHADNFPEVYAPARHDAEGSLRDHGEQSAADALPRTCPYTLDQITSDWLPCDSCTTSRQ